jgi:hypothetical protein
MAIPSFPRQRICSMELLNVWYFLQNTALARLEFLKALFLKIQDFWDVTPC